jgi:hypothetical protein
MSTAKTKAQKIIDENNVVVFSKSYCPYCKASKALLNEKGAKYFLMELDQVGEFHLPPFSIIDFFSCSSGLIPRFTRPYANSLLLQRMAPLYKTPSKALRASAQCRISSSTRSTLVATRICRLGGESSMGCCRKLVLSR